MRRPGWMEDACSLLMLRSISLHEAAANTLGRRRELLEHFPRSSRSSSFAPASMVRYDGRFRIVVSNRFDEHTKDTSAVNGIIQCDEEAEIHGQSPRLRTQASEQQFCWSQPQ